MSVHIALLRAVNVGGRNRVANRALQDLAAGLGFSEVRAVLQTGNLVFTAAATDTAALERRLEAAIAQDLGVETDVLVRSAAEWRGIVAANPFGREARDDPAHLLLMLLKEAPDAGQVAALQAAISGRERVAVSGRQAFLVYPDGIGRSKLTAALIERRLGCRGTARNWNTVQTLRALAGG